jgi:hypothetical protein
MTAPTHQHHQPITNQRLTSPTDPRSHLLVASSNSPLAAAPGSVRRMTPAVAKRRTTGAIS